MRGTKDIAGDFQGSSDLRSRICRRLRLGVPTRRETRFESGQATTLPSHVLTISPRPD